jgi:hypothetical protein
MSRPKHPTRVLIAVLTSLVAGSLACSLFSSPATSTLSVEDALATMTLMVWTPTLPPTLTPLPSSTPENTPTSTVTPLPTLTPTPSYDGCKGMDTRSTKDSDVKLLPPKGDKGYAAYACLLEVVGPLKYDYPETALLVKIGFNDKGGELHIYPAVIGGLIYTKSSPQDFQYPACSASQPKMLGLTEYTDSLQPYLGTSANAKPFLMYIYTDMGYVSHSPPEASLVNRYADINQQLQSAVKTGNDFPEVPDKFRLFILPGLELCK